jgi:hypothetical protein
MNHSKKWLKAVTSKEYREKLSKASKKTWSNPIIKEKRIKNIRKITSSNSYKQKQRKITKNNWNNLIIKEKRLNGIRKATSSKEYREKQSKISRERYSNPKEIEKARKLWTMQKKEKLRKKIDIAVTKWWKEHPHVRKKYSDRLKNYFIKNPKDFADKFYNGKNNPFCPHIKTKLGLVRSKGEKQIADFLVKNKIKAEYEAKTLMLDGYICVPDFYLEKYNTYIEFYGGYPGSRTKKVLKNKLYKKHNLKVIAITPGKLYNLKKEILEKLS